MTIIHMEPEQVRSAARQLDAVAGQIFEQAGQAGGRVRSIPWSSPNRERFVSQMDQVFTHLKSLAQQGSDLSRRVLREADEWESVAATFGMRSWADPAGRITPGAPGGRNTRTAPRNMKELASLVMEGGGTVRIYRIGDNEYLLIIQGTNVSDSNVSNNWGSAITTGMGQESDFQKTVAAAVMGLPAGAVVHMAGHSQGGIVANNLAASQEIRNHVTVGSVTTFGSPVSAPEAANVDYRRYAAEGDIVPYLEGRDLFTTALMAPIIGVPGALAVSLADRAPQTEISAGSSSGIVGTHMSYKDSSELEKISGNEMPFSVDKEAWNEPPQVIDPGTARSGLAVIQKNLMGTVETVADTTGRAAGTVGNFFGHLF